jgi:gliding motility-associated-like protein
MMKIRAKIVLLLTLLVCGITGIAQNISNKGKEFWVGYGHHQYMEPPCNGGTASNDMNMVIYLSAEEAAVVTITIDSSTAIPATWYRKTYTIPANTVIQTENMPKGLVDAAASGTNPQFDARLYTDPFPAGTSGEGLFRRKGIHITSNVPIVAYAHIYGGVSSGATMLLPIETWGYTYTSVNSEQRDADRSYSWMYVVAKENNTRVTITPVAQSRLGKPAGVPFTVDLQKGQIYQLIGDAVCSTGNGPELTGTTVKSIPGLDGICHAIAVFSGSSRTGGETFTCGTGSGRDNDMQQSFPEQSWGKRYLTAPFSKASSGTSLQPSSFQTSVYKVVVKDVNTKVWRNNILLTNLINGKFYKFSSSVGDYIEADKPVMVAQYMSGTGTCNGSLGDPEMVYLSPIEQAIKKVGFFRNSKEAIGANYVTLIVPTAGVPSLRIDGSNTFSHTYVHPNKPGYTVVIKGWASVPAGAQVIVSCDSAFNGITYGLGGAESYGYNVGTYFNILSAISDIHNKPDTSGTLISHPYAYVGTPTEIGALIAYRPTQMTWLLNTLGGDITPNGNVTVNNPVPIDSVLVGSAWYYRYRLPGTYVFNRPDSFYIPIQLSSNIFGAGSCLNDEKVFVLIIVKPRPTATFSYTVRGCGKDTVSFVSPATSAGLPVIKWKWTFPNGDTSDLQNPKYLFDTGRHQVRLTMTIQYGGLADTVITVVVPPKPIAGFKANPTTVCLNQPIVFTDTTAATGITNYYWDFGNTQMLNVANNTPQSIVYTSPGIYTVRHSIKISNYCISDTVSSTVKVSAKAVIAFTYPLGCLPASGLAQFGADTVDLGGQKIVSYNWNFGDGNASVSNPNTSTLQKPTHTYSAVGSYSVTLSVVTTTGCSGDTTVSINMNVQPTLQFDSLSPVCQSATSFTVAKATVTNAVPGTGYYKGAGTDSAGMFNPSVAGAGSHTIWYIFSSTGGCKDSVSRVQKVFATPVPKFGYSTGCLPVNGLVQFSDSSIIADGQPLVYLWNFGDANATGSNPNTSTQQSPTHNYSDGTYNVKLTLNTANGCSKDTTVPIIFKLTPQLSFAALPTVCESVVGVIKVDSAKVLNGLTGRGIYKGTATDSLGNFIPSLAGAGTHTIWYVFTSTSGCKDSLSATILVNAAPTAGFTSTTGCLPFDGLVQFTNTSTVAAGQTLSYLWNFGDANANTGNPNTSTVQDPTHKFAEGSYSIKLTTTAANGCMKDTTITTVLSVKPQVAFAALTAVCESVTGTVSVANGSVTNGVTGKGIYRGPSTDTLGNFTPSLAGPGTHTIWYVFTTTGGCKDSLSQTITVNAGPKAAFSYSTGCLPSNGLVQFTNASTISTGQTLSYAWNFGDANATGANPNTSTQTSPTHTYSEGSYSIKLTVTSPNGCAKDTTITTSFSIKPVVTYAALPAVCESVVGTISVASGNVTNGVTGKGIYRGPATDTLGNFTPSVAGPGTHTIWYVFTTTGGCKDSLSQQILVNAGPKASFTYSSGCLPADGLVQFTNASSISTGQALTYAWNFGDANATGANPNTSTQISPTHNYTEGTYSIKLTASANGCTKDTTVTTTFSLKPVLAYSSLSAVCETVNGTVSVASGTVTNGVTGTTTYRGPATDATGNFTPSLAGAGTHTIWYVFTTTGGCKDSLSQQITVNAGPKASFTSSTGCLPTDGLVQFTNASTISTGQALTYAWNFGDANASGTNPNTSTQTSPSHNYKEGTYTIKLTATSANGCTKDTSGTITFSVTPALAYAALTPVCESVTGTVTVASGSVTNGVTGTGVYRGAGTDAAGNFTPSLAGAGTHTIWYVFTTAGGCKDSVSKTIQVYAKPVSSFTSSTGCLPTNGLVQFTNTSSITPNGVLSYLWNFGDANASGTNPNTSTQTNPTHNYKEGTYSIKLTTTSANGCVKDTTVSTTFSVKPAVTYAALTAVCESTTGVVSVASGSVTNGVTGTAVYRGPATDAAGNFMPSSAGAGTHTIWYIFTTAGGCKDSASTTIQVYAKPKASFGYPVGGCLPQNGLVQFTNATSVTGGGALTYSWNFGDPNATGANPNTSTQTQPSHFYAEGTYTIKLTATSANACFGDTSVTTAFTLKPQVTYAALPAVCESVTGTVSVAKGSVLNGVAGTPVYRGIATDAVGNFTPSIAGAGTHTVWYVFTGTGGCKDSMSQTITVDPRPAADFTLNSSSICLDKTVVITNASSANTTGWAWDFGNGNTATTAGPFTRSYSSATNYTIKLTVTSNKGCTSTTTSKQLTVDPLPVADFQLPGSICLNNGSGQAQFTNKSKISTNGALTYAWDFGDGSTPSSAINPTHTYNSAGPFSVSLVVTSDKGCIDDSIQVLNTFYQKPVAGFSVTPDTLCQGTPNSFTDASAASGSTVQSWLWKFGDGTTSTQKDPTKTFAFPSDYSVTLVVKSAQGCISDPFQKSVSVFVQPVIDAGPSFFVPSGTLVQFNATANDTSTVKLLWTPYTSAISNATELHPTLVADVNQVYTLTATGQGSCVATDTLSVKVYLPVVIPNAFSPNGDAINDTWVLDNLKDYPRSSVEVFDRYGKSVFMSNGYTQPWDGKVNGKPLPVGVYYYLIDLKNDTKPLAGWVTILK